jgi:hypothetical protein
LCARSCNTEVDIRRVQTGKQLAGANSLADVDEPFGDLAGDPEADGALHPRCDNASIAVGAAVGRAYDGKADKGRFGRDFGGAGAACGEPQSGAHQDDRAMSKA